MPISSDAASSTGPADAAGAAAASSAPPMQAPSATWLSRSAPMRATQWPVRRPATIAAR